MWLSALDVVSILFKAAGERCLGQVESESVLTAILSVRPSVERSVGFIDSWPRYLAGQADVDESQSEQRT